MRKEDFAVIEALKVRDVYKRDIAVQLGVHPKTVCLALRRSSAPAGARKRRMRKLNSHKAAVDRLLVEVVWCAAVILLEIQAAAHGGGHTMLWDMLRPNEGCVSGEFRRRLGSDNAGVLEDA